MLKEWRTMTMRPMRSRSKSLRMMTNIRSSRRKRKTAMKILYLRAYRKTLMMAMMMSAVTQSQMCVMTKKGMGFYCLVSLRIELVNSHQPRV